MQSCRHMTPYQSDSGDEAGAFVAPHRWLLRESAVPRRHALRPGFDALKRVAWTGAPWRGLPHEVPPGPRVSQQAMRWRGAGVFEAMGHDLRVLLRDVAGCKKRPRAALRDSRTLQSTPESGPRAGYEGAQRNKGSTRHRALDALGPLRAAPVTPADAPDRDQVKRRAARRGGAGGDRRECRDR